MAWEWGLATINEGESVRWSFTWDGYPGIQVFRAKPVLSAENDVRFGVQGELAVTNVSLDWEPRADRYIYRLTVTHLGGWSPQSYRIVGTKVS